MSEEWYRNSTWTPEIEQVFHEKLKRSRSQRDQYIVLQAHHLSNNEPEVALKLIDFYFETRSDDWEGGRAERIRATARLKLGQVREAVFAYKRLLESDRDNPALVSGSGIEFAFLVAMSRAADEYLFALEQLADLASIGIPAAQTRFKYNAAKAILLLETGHIDLARLHAADAMKDAETLSGAESELPHDDAPEGIAAAIWRLRHILRK